MVAASELVHGLPEAALSGLRSGGGGARVEARDAGDAREIALAISRSVAVATERGASVARRRRDAVIARGKIRSRKWRSKSLGQRRSAKPDAKLQGARHGRRGFDG